MANESSCKYAASPDFWHTLLLSRASLPTMAAYATRGHAISWIRSLAGGQGVQPLRCSPPLEVAAHPNLNRIAHVKFLVR